MEENDENYRKHLEFAQLNIARMTASAFHYKSWMIAVVSAIFAVFAATQHTAMILVALIPSFSFWILDAFHLAAEKNFQNLYEDIRKRKLSNFEMKPPTIRIKGWISAAISKTLIPLYVPLIIFILITYCLMT